MKTRLLSLLTALLCATTIGWAQSVWLGSGNSADPYLLKSSNEWEALAKQVAEGKNFQNQFFRLSADIDTKGIQVGSLERPFCGVFDGDNHTLRFTVGEGGCIQIRHNNTLYVHDQPNAYNNQGKLVMGADGKADGIGLIYQEDGSPGSAEFHGGDIRITACHDGKPAIGTGNAGKNILGTKFTFYSGNYYLQGGRTAAGFGAGSDGSYCGEITIYGGNIEAIGSPEKVRDIAVPVSVAVAPAQTVRCNSYHFP